MPLTYRPFAESPALKSIEPRLSMNVGESERKLSMLGGALLALLGLSRKSIGGVLLAVGGGALVYRGYSGHCSVYQALGINSNEAGVRGRQGIKIERTVDIQAPRSEVYSYWRELGNLPNFMEHVREIREISPTRSHWIVDAPAGATVEWDAEIINERRDSLLAWQSLPGAEVQNAGTVRFEDLPGGGTRLSLQLEFHPPAGSAGAAIAKLLGESPEEQVDVDLGRFRHQIERLTKERRSRYRH